MLYWITGKAKAGKTTYAYRLAAELKERGESPVVLDGDEIRAIYATGFSDEDRERHIICIAKLAKRLEGQGLTPIVALISPLKVWRQQARALFSESVLIYIPGGTLWPNTTYEEPDQEELGVGNCCVDLDPKKAEYSLFIGRYQPFHPGHKRLIERVLEEGKNVCIAVRDTAISISNPYILSKRIQLIKDEMADWNKDGIRVMVIPIPDITEVCYGRKVGWGVREIRLDEEVEKISATEIREGINA